MDESVKVDVAYRIGTPILMNKFFFKSCYYHDLIAALGCLRINGLKLLQNQKLCVKENFECSEDSYLDEKAFEKKMGYHIESLNLTRETLFQYIRNNKPLIVGVDCYYMKERGDEYLKKHYRHFIMVYGYDLNRGVLNIVDHNYLNSLMFEEKEIYIDTLLEYNQKYCDRYCNSERPYSCKVVIKDVPFMEFDIAQLCKTEEKRNLVNTIKNLQELKVFFINTKKPSRAEFDKIETYLLTIQRYKQTRLYAGLNLSPKKELKLNKLIGGYSLLLGLIRKSYFKKEFLVSDELREKCFVKIDEMIILEKELNESGEKN